VVGPGQRPHVTALRSPAMKRAMWMVMMLAGVALLVAAFVWYRDFTDDAESSMPAVVLGIVAIAAVFIGWIGWADWDDDGSEA
jgi:protein-S-isoprenylcysteine O-methyltransferase Ste14